MSIPATHRSTTRWGLLPSFAERGALPLPARLLIIGPIGLGDTVLALAALRVLRQASPAMAVVWSGRAAHEPIVRMAGVHDFVPAASSAAQAAFSITSPAFDSPDTALHVRDGFDAVLTFRDVGADALAPFGPPDAIPVRIGAANGLRRQWCNHLVHTKRLGRPRHEAMRNLRLLLPFGLPTRASLGEAASLGRVTAVRAALPPDMTLASRYAVLHPFSAGHAREWPVGHWIELAGRLVEQGVAPVFTGSAEDGAVMAAAWPHRARPRGVVDAFGRLDLSQLATVLVDASAVIACSTGPLHLAACLGAPAIGLFVPRKGLGPDRWAALGPAAIALQAHRRCPWPGSCEPTSCRCIRDLSVEQVETTIHSSIIGRPPVDSVSSHRLPSDEQRTA